MSLAMFYNQTYAFPVEFENVPANKRLVDENIVLKTTINSKGWDIVFKKVKNKVIKIDLAEYPESNEYTFSNAKAMVQEKITGLKVQEVDPAYFSVILKKLESKKVPIKLNLKKNFATNFFFSEEAIVKPDSIIISSDKLTLSKIDFIETQEIEITEADTLLKNIKLDIPKNISIEKKTISLILNTEEFVEKEFSIPIIVDNNLEKQAVIIFPQTIKLKCLVPIRIYENIMASDFYISADFDNIGVRNDNYLFLNVKEQPKGVKNIQLEKDKVEFIIYQ